jgi:hypothetical protein
LLLKLVHGRVHGFVYRAGAYPRMLRGNRAARTSAAVTGCAGAGPRPSVPLDPREQFINLPTLAATHGDWEGWHLLAPAGYWRAAILIQDAG